MRKKIKIKKLPIKIILVLIAIAAVIVTPTVLMLRVFQIREEGLSFVLYIVISIAVAVLILLFAFAVHRIIIIRVRKLNNAASEVIKGNFDVSVEAKGHDELSQLTQTFNEMTAELKANEYLSKQFVRSVSHEFKTPIASIKGYAEMIDKQGDTSQPDIAKVKRYAGIIMEESDRLVALSKSILQLSLLDSTTLIKKDDIVSVAGQIRIILLLMQKAGEDKDIDIILNLEEFNIATNEQLAHQIWLNLISNAIKFSNHGGKIIITLKKIESGLKFEIEDNGVGIKDEDKDKLFNQFFMADKSRNSDGSGLGLAIVKRIVEKLGGNISFESQEHNGTKFIVNL